ncbi:hypothetical protein O9992_28595 [Vibrio lentus]|nr:hypothetical protein [Vibrio lentus]
MVNRTTLGVYPLGSTDSPSWLLQVCRNMLFPENTIRNDHGSRQIPGSKPNLKAWRDWKRWGHGPVDVTTSY